MNATRMLHGRGRLLVPALLLSCLVFSACSPDAETEEEATAEAEEEGPEEEGTSTRVTLSEAAHRTADIQVEAVRSDTDDRSAGGLEVPGNVEFAPDRVAMVSSRSGGRVERLMVVPGDRVAAGQPVGFLFSPAFLTAQNDLLQAARRVSNLQGTREEEGARALLQAARRRLQMLGAPAEGIDALAAGGPVQDLLPVTVPVAGSITEAYALVGSAVEPGTPIYKVADLSVVHVVADVPEAALGRVAPGQRATVRVTAYPGLQLEGTVTRIREELDPETRTAKAVIQVANPDRRLRPGMFAGVSLAGVSGSAQSQAVLTIPQEAVVTDGAERYVFVEIGERTYERREVQVRPASEGRLAVDSGLAPGDRVVVRGAFTLKSELGKAEFGEEEGA